MTEHVRTGYRRHRKAAWAAVLTVLVAAALAIVLPAVGSNTVGCSPDATTCVKPASAAGITPSILNVGGSNFSCTTSAGGQPTGMRQFQISKPTPGQYTDPATGVTFTIGPPTDSKLDPKSYFSFSVGGAAVYHVGVNGGTNTAWYDYFANAGSMTTGYQLFPNGGVARDENLHSTPDSKYKYPSSLTFFTASITTFCYVPLTVQPSCTAPFSGLGFGGTGGSVEYSAQLVSPDGTSCKGSNVVMYSYTSGTSSFFATLNPVTEDPNATKYRVIEHIRWSGITSNSQNLVPDLWYDDTYPYDGGDKKTLKMCNLDARSTSNPFVLASDPNTNAPYTDAQILPSGETSCLFLGSDSAGTSPTNRIFEAWIYSKVDGARGVT